jgi:hypothetical protein
VSTCAYIATHGNTGTGVPVEGQFFSVGSDSGSANSVLVHSVYRNGVAEEDDPFHLAVLC